MNYTNFKNLIPSSDLLDNPSKLAEQKKYLLLRFDLEQVDFLTLNGTVYSKNDIIEFFDDLNKNLPQYKVLMGDAMMAKFLYSNKMPPNYYMMKYDASLLLSIKEDANKAMFHLFCDYLETDNYNFKTEVEKIKLFIEKFPEDYFEAALEWIESDLSTFLENLAERHMIEDLNFYAQATLSNEFHLRHHFFIVTIIKNPSFIYKYNKFVRQLIGYIIRMANNGFISMPPTYYKLLKFLATYIQSVEGGMEKILEAFDKNEAMKTKIETESDTSYWHVIAVILVILRIIFYLSRN